MALTVVTRLQEDIAATVSRLKLTNVSFELNEVNLGKPAKAAGAEKVVHLRAYMEV